MRCGAWNTPVNIKARLYAPRLLGRKAKDGFAKNGNGSLAAPVALLFFLNSASFVGPPAQAPHERCSLRLLMF